MNENNNFNKSFDHVSIYKNLHQMSDKLNLLIKDNEKSGFSDIDLEISGIMHSMTYFSIIVQMFYPLETTFERMKQNLTNPNTDDTIKSQVENIDLINRKSFLVITAFNFETLLNVIADKHGIIFNSQYRIIDNYLQVFDYFGIKHEKYENLLKIFHYTRNTLHSGTKIKRAWGPLDFEGETFSVQLGQKLIKHTSWDYFTYFTDRMINIFKEIYESPKFDNN